MSSVLEVYLVEAEGPRSAHEFFINLPQTDMIYHQYFSVKIYIIFACCASLAVKYLIDMPINASSTSCFRIQAARKCLNRLLTPIIIIITSL